MKRITRLHVVILTLSLFLAGGVAALAQGQRGGGPPDHAFGGPGPGPGIGFLHGIFHELDLTDEQREQVHARVDEAMAGELGQILQDRRQKHHELQQLIHDPSTEEAAITAAVRRITADSELLALAQHRLSVSVFEVLTPEQREQALELLAEQPPRMHRMQRRMHRHAPAPDPED